MKKRAIFNKELWQSFLALAGHFLKSLNSQRIRGEDFFTEGAYQEFKKRIEGLTQEAPAIWGTMRVEHMLRHVNLSIGCGQGLYILPDESYLLSRTLIKWMVIDWYNEQPKGLRLPLSMVIQPDERFDFETEKNRLLVLLDSATSSRSQEDWKPHCYFGKLSVKQWGKLCMLHLDYHLKQFSA
ncbi:DUF1569 domain-containing protein [Mucilaginibacter sp.]|uniref:DUF1569 domain-containing protein n=1 Tax=Mucilaginibacter sp. TaxID=1882438 RepID=UPI0035BC78E9